jgi:hypothetical protein
MPNLTLPERFALLSIGHRAFAGTGAIFNNHDEWIDCSSRTQRIVLQLRIPRAKILGTVRAI